MYFLHHLSSEGWMCGTGYYGALKLEWPQVHAEKRIDERPLRKWLRVRLTLIAYGVRINPCSRFAEST